MTYRRLLVLYSAFIALFFILICRIYLLANNEEYASSAQNQTITTLSLTQTRGDFVDCNGEKLTGLTDTWYALCIPGEDSYTELFYLADAEAQSVLYQNRNSAIPFLIEVETDLTAQGVYTVSSTERYATVPFATHLIGYINGDGDGVSGLEAALDDVLSGEGIQSYIQCVTNAQGSLMDDTEPTLYSADNDYYDVQLTLDKTIQRIAEGVASATMTQGQILILETDTAKVRASVSMPTYDPDNVAASIAADDSSLMNRALNAYNVGSVFKPVLAAAAIENDLDWFTIECVGYTEINGHIYHCSNGIAHGTVNLNTALEQSCNCYFVALGQLLGGDVVSSYGSAFGFGEAVYLAGGLKSAAGNMPTSKTLQDLGQLANTSFGQGELLATPVQVAGMMNAIANEGVYITPSFIEGLLDPETGECVVSYYDPTITRIIDESTASALQKILIDVVEEGTATAAQPNEGGAGGKTGTAQTGRYVQAVEITEENLSFFSDFLGDNIEEAIENAQNAANENVGEEYKDLWFAGFYPADDPQYTIVIMQDEQISPETSCTEIFAQICNAIALLAEDDI